MVLTHLLREVKKDVILNNNDVNNHKNIETVNCAGIALTNNGRIFLIRPFYADIAQSYAIPKGHVNDGEDFKEAAIREFKEETGIDLKNKKLYELTCVYTKIGNDKVKKVTVFEVNGNGNEKFKGSINSDYGSPETIHGEYIPFKIAREFITGYQIPIIDELMKDDTSSLVNFYNKRNRHD